MMVNGPLEIYGSVIGIKLFDALFNILASMGIIFIPLLILLFDNLTKPYESEIENGASTSLRKVAIHLFLWIITVMLFVAPTWKLDVTSITYQPKCTPSATASRFGDTGTTYDDVFAHEEYENLRMPLMMTLVLMGMSGFTNAAITSLPCKTDVQAIKGTIDTARLSPLLTQQVQRFQDECFAPARASFDSTHPDPATYQTLMNHYGGQVDLSWLGSHVLQSLYYGNQYPLKPVVGFPYAQYPNHYDSYNRKQGIPTPQWGYPTCQQWWSDSDHGLQGQLVQLVSDHDPHNPHLGEQSFSDKVSAWLAEAKRFSHLGSQVTAADVISRNLLYDVGANSGFGRNYDGWMDNDANPLGGSSSWLHGALAHGIAAGGQALDATWATVDRAETADEIPILQAVLLAFALTLGPLIILMGLMTGQGIRVIFTYYFLLGSLLFMTFIERFIHYLEMSLHASQSGGVYAMGNTAMMYNVFTKLYFYGPMLYLMLMSIAGVGVGSSVGKAFSSSSSGSAQRLGKNMVSKIAMVAK